jgi:16S rRNA (cytosine1402-N4)-methyltransferase
MTELNPASPRHIAVLPAEVLQYLNPGPGETWVDATVGAGGHAALILERLGPTGRLIALDQDASMLALAQARLPGRQVHFFQASFDQLREVFKELGLEAVDGLLADVGVSSDQLDDPARGLSFQREGPLDMRLNPQAGQPARWLVNRLGERELADLFWQFGEERFSFRIARKIVKERQDRPIETTTQLAEIVRRSVPRPKKRKGSIDPATRVFQALRIAVNDELGALDRLLKILPSCIRPGGRAGVISFHSLEDRLVKRAFQDRSAWEVLTRKPVQAGDDEIRVNPRSRSAKLRVARRLTMETSAELERGRGP